MKLFLSLVSLVITVQGFGAAESLESGLYSPRASSNVCDGLIDQSTDRTKLFWEATGSDCGDAGKTVVFQFDGEKSIYAGLTNTVKITAENVKSCTPVAGKPLPCADLFYSESKKLIMQVGDTLRSFFSIEIINSSTLLVKDYGELWSASPEQFKSKSKAVEIIFRRRR